MSAKAARAAITRRTERQRRTWRFYPGSFPMLILAGFALAVLPLIFALINNAVSIHELASKSQRAVINAVQVTQSTRLLIEQITSMERGARQFSILADPELYAVFETAHRDFGDTAKRMRGLDLAPGQVRVLNQMVDVENRLYAEVAALRQQPRLVADLMDDYTELGRLGRSLDTTGREAVARETTAMQALSGEVHNFIYWQLVALIPVALFLVTGATLLILKPIRQVEAALKRLGEGDFRHPVSVSGPKDLEDLGRQIDWVRLRLIELEDQKTRFLHQLSHELKTPLSAIREGAELLADGSVGPLSQPQVEVSRILRENTLRLQRLIEDLLNYHTIQFQRSGVHLRRVELGQVISRVAEAQQLPMRAKDIKLKVVCPAITLEADENKLEIILDNLLSNAVKFSPPFGEITVAARVRGNEVVVDVIDQGPGIAPADREHVFDPFYQGKARPHETVKGTGLGLAIVREYVAAHGGRVEIVETSNPGAHFQLRLPLSPNAQGR
jgi:two-component system sensor histidine kinase GlrK